MIPAEIAAILPEGDVLAVYTVACLILFITPGPDMSLFLARTMSSGRRAGLCAMAGTMAGTCIHTLLAALGLSAIVAASATAFSVLKIVGAVYLLWLAIDAIRRGSALNLAAAATRRPLRPWRVFLAGLTVNLTNPKIVLFFVTFLPQFVTAGDPHAAGKLMFMGFYFVALSLPMSALLIVGAERTIATMKGRPRLMRGVDYLFAAVFGAFAIRIATLGSR